ncbi:MAG: hypothetical protein IJ193_07650 [Bacilli bacterium]|nr:hypothetical protein [Bacilli bacterium]
MKEKWKSLGRRKQKKILLIIELVLVFILIPGTYALYKGLMNVNVTTVAGEMISDIEIDQKDSYIENNVPYFYVTVKNYRINGNNTLLTATAFDYTLVISNKDGSNGKFSYVDENGNSSSEYASTLRIENCHLDQTMDSDRFKIYVTRDGNLRTQVDYKVQIEADQATATTTNNTSNTTNNGE